MGGDGGRGASIWAVADRNLNTLIDFRYNRVFRGQKGENGHGADRYGKGGADLELRMPVGTVITDSLTGELIADLDTDGKRWLIARGGIGGLGNSHFKSSTNRAPRQNTPGQAGEKRELKLELKVLADVGLLGLPNAGKSTFIRAVSAAKPKVADYPFTTLYPNLGVVRVDDKGAWLGVEEGLTCYCFVRDLVGKEGDGRVERAQEAVKVGMEIDVEVKSFDRRFKKVSVSMRAVIEGDTREAYDDYKKKEAAEGQKLNPLAEKLKGFTVGGEAKKG